MNNIVNRPGQQTNRFMYERYLIGQQNARIFRLCIPIRVVFFHARFNLKDAD